MFGPYAKTLIHTAFVFVGYLFIFHQKKRILSVSVFFYIYSFDFHFCAFCYVPFHTSFSVFIMLTTNILLVLLPPYLCIFPLPHIFQAQCAPGALNNLHHMYLEHSLTKQDDVGRNTGTKPTQQTLKEHKRVIISIGNLTKWMQKNLPQEQESTEILPLLQLSSCIGDGCMEIQIDRQIDTDRKDELPC